METNRSNKKAEETGREIPNEQSLLGTVNPQDYSIANRDDYLENDAESQTGADSNVDDGSNNGEELSAQEETADGLNLNGGYGGESTPAETNT